MRIVIVSDAWLPQVNGVVRTLMRTVDELKGLGHEMQVISPDLFKSFPCPTYAEIPSSPAPSISPRKARSASPPGATACAGSSLSPPPSIPAFPNM